MRKKESEKIGLPPGTIVHIGEEKDFKPIIKFISYNKDEYSEDTFENYNNYDFLTSIKDRISNSKISWINVMGVHDTALLGKIGDVFDINSMILEDISSTMQQPYLDIYGNTILLQIKNINFNAKILKAEPEMMSFIMTKDCIFSFQENQDDTLIKIKQRIELSKGKIRTMGKDYLFYVLIDIIVDNYFKTLEDTTEQIDMIEEEIYIKQSNEAVRKIHQLKKALLYYKKSVIPLREIVNRFVRNDDKFFDDNLVIYLHDLYNHIINIIDSIESYRDIMSGLLDLYLSNNGNKINEVMKILTVVSTIFIPLGFLTGVFGMNFVNMQELTYNLSYPFGFWGITLIIVLVMFLYFRKKKWM